jgi:NOL1/NOP2/fmu family ribosome biogenesis protein
MNECNNKGFRVRINVSTSVKGVKTHDSTIELNDKEMSEMPKFVDIALQESDRLVNELDKRYPPQV